MAGRVQVEIHSLNRTPIDPGYDSFHYEDIFKLKKKKKKAKEDQ